MKQLQELITALEKLEGPSREVDGRIEFVVNRERFGTDETGDIGYFKRHGMGKTEKELLRHVYREYEAKDLIPRYTSSIDSALTLVPKGWRWSSMSEREPYRPEGQRTMYLRGPQSTASPLGNLVFGDHTSNAIALCIASLKARLSSTENTES